MVKCPSCGAELDWIIESMIWEEGGFRLNGRIEKASASPEKTEQKEFADQYKIDEVRNAFTKEMADKLEFTVDGKAVLVHAKQYFRDKRVWNEINSYIKEEFGGKWISDGKKSHWRIG